MTEVKWIKVVVDIFDDDKIKLIETLPDGDSVIVCWFKLLCLAGRTNNSGVLFLTDKIPYTDEMLSTIFRRPLQTVRLALATFEKFGMVEIVNDVITIPNWEKHQSLDGMEKVREQTRERVQRHREKQKLLAASSECNVTRNVTETLCNAIDIDIEEDLEKDIDSNTIAAVVEKWNTLGLNQVRDCKGNRKVLLQARIREHGLDAILEALDRVRDSDFLHGQNQNGWTITFDWFVRPQNFQKVLEDNYRNRRKEKKSDLSGGNRNVNKLLDQMDRL